MEIFEKCILLFVFMPSITWKGEEPFEIIFNWPPVKLSKQTVAKHEIAIVLQIFEEEPHVGQREG
jgi:hypothetical protein